MNATYDGMDAGCQPFDADTPDASFMEAEAIDEDMLEGLKGMFHFHRDYLHAVWKRQNSSKT